jgi:probable phosphoglycerate mutase
MHPPVYFMRHGHTDWNAQYRLQGQADTDINALGREQAARNGRRLADLVGDPSGFEFVASPLRRTRQTMELVREAMGLRRDGYRTDARLMELHFGDWQGFTYEELEAREPGSTAQRLFDKWSFLPPGGQAENYALLADRVRPWLEEIVQPTVCVTHGGVIRVIFYLVARLSERHAAALDISQDQMLRMRDGTLEWF